MANRPFPFEAFARIVGGTNWVVARRTRRIIEQCGEDVICLSPRKYEEAARAAMIEVYGTEED